MQLQMQYMHFIGADGFGNKIYSCRTDWPLEERTVLARRTCFGEELRGELGLPVVSFLSLPLPFAFFGAFPSAVIPDETSDGSPGRRVRGVAVVVVGRLSSVVGRRVLSNVQY